MGYHRPCKNLHFTNNKHTNYNNNNSNDMLKWTHRVNTIEMFIIDMKLIFNYYTQITNSLTIFLSQ